MGVLVGKRHTTVYIFNISTCGTIPQETYQNHIAHYVMGKTATDYAIAYVIVPAFGYVGGAW